VLSFLRISGLIVAAIWLGAAVFFTFFAGPAFFSPEMAQILPKPHAGAAAQVLIKRYFLLHVLCGGLALIHLGLGWLYAGRPIRALHLWLLIALFGIGLVGRVALIPKMQSWQFKMYSTRFPAEQVAAARKSFGLWHGITQGVNLLVLAGLFAHLVRTDRDNQIAHFISSSKFRG
jgi:hypothetical protein